MVHKVTGKRMMLYAVLFSAVLMLIKFYAFFITGSNTILSDALESIINVAAGGFALGSLVLSLRPKDNNHPYGHGKIEFISSGAEGTMIIIAGLSIIIKSASSFLEPKTLTSLDTGLLLITISGILNYIVGYGIMKRGQKTHALILEANGKHLMTDAYSTAGIMVGLVLIYATDLFWLDDAFAIVVGIMIIVTGVKIIRKSLAGVMDEADFTVIDELVHHLNIVRKPEWIDIHNLRTIKYGNTIHIDCHATLPWYWTIQQGHSEISRISESMNNHLPRNLEFFIHVDPCKTTMCPKCSLDCSHRKDPFQKLIPWTSELIIENKK